MVGTANSLSLQIAYPQGREFEMHQIDELFSDEEIWKYLHIAYQLESAGNAVVESLRDGRTVEQAYTAWVEPGHSLDLTAREITLGMAFAQLLMPDRENLIVEYEALRYPGNVLTADEWRRIKETISRQLNRRG
jgi:hypothetical protein